MLLFTSLLLLSEFNVRLLFNSDNKDFQALSDNVEALQKSVSLFSKRYYL